MLTIVKRDGSKVKYEGEKIVTALKLASASCGCAISNGLLSEIEEDIYNEMINSDLLWTVEDISDRAEEMLMKHNKYEIAKEFILYRYRRTEDRLIEDKSLFVESYKSAKNAATGSQFDSNANVEQKNIATLSGELNKRENILLNRKLMTNKIKELYGEELANEYIRQLESHEIYKHDETSIMPYCVAINMYPFLTDGLGKLGGHSNPPTHLQAFNGSFINLVFAIASQFAGAVATPEYFLYMDYFVRKEFGDDYHLNVDRQVVDSNRPRTIEKVIEDSFQQVVYSLNQPAAARNYQSVFWNVSYFDKYYFESMFSDFIFPDFTKPQWESLNWLQKKFMSWFNEERLKKPLTFPVETMALLIEDGDVKDKEYGDFTAEMYSKGHSFFTYTSESADSLSSCCRLRNEIQDNTFSFSLGAGGVATGSKSVMTININRLVQNAVRIGVEISDAVREQVRKVHKYQTAYNEIMKDNLKAGLMPVFDAGFISLDKQYLTIGINGAIEGAEFLGIKITPSKEYQDYIENILKPIYEENKKAKTDELMFNTEFVPAENLGVKNADWDAKDGYFVPRELYNSYFYIVEDENTNLIDKFKLHGKESVQFLDGGSALHANLDEHLTKEQYRQLLKVACTLGCNYFTFNIPNTICNECEFISKQRLYSCPNCGSNNVDFLTRVIGYLKRVSSFSVGRQKEEGIRYYDNLR